MATQEIITLILSPIKKLSEFVQSKIADLGIQYSNQMATLLTIFLGVLIFWIGTKVANKIAKFVLWILGVILILGTISIVIGNFIN